MGSCVSRPESCVGGRRRRSVDGKRRKRRRLVKRRTMVTIDEVDGHGDDRMDFDNRDFQKGSIEEAWFETVAIEESDCEDDFHSVKEEMFSLHGSEGESTSNASSFKDANRGDIDQQHNQLKQGEQFIGNLENNGNNQCNGSLNSSKRFVTHEDISSLSVDEGANKEEGGVLDSCGGILPNNCLPCIATTASIAEKRKSFTSSPPNSAKKASLKLSFKRKSGEGHSPPAL